MNLVDNTPEVKGEYSVQPFEYKTAKQTGSGWLPTTDHLKDIILDYAVCMARLKSGVRRNSHFMYADYCCLDFDNTQDLGVTTLEEAVENIFCDSWHVIATSVSHTKENHRFRVFLKLSSRIYDLNHYKQTISSHMHWPGIDPASKVGVQFFKPVTKIISVCDDGFCVDVPEPKKNPYIVSSKVGVGYLTPYVISLLYEKIIPIGHRDDTTFRIAKDLKYKMLLSKEETKQFIVTKFNFESSPRNPWGEKEISNKVEQVYRKDFSNEPRKKARC